MKDSRTSGISSRRYSAKHITLANQIVTALSPAAPNRGTSSSLVSVGVERPPRSCRFATVPCPLLAHLPFSKDQFASPPLHLASSQLLRSQELADWAKFIGRLALHPRIYLKLSPFPLSNLFKSTPLSQTRTADYLSSAVQAAADAASHLASTTESITGEDVSTLSPSSSTGADLSTTSPEERAAEVKRRLRIFLDVSLEAFGVDRLIWASTIGADHSTAAVLPGHAGQDEENVAKEWYELVRESLASMGLDEDSLEGIFSGNASKVYRT